MTLTGVTSLDILRITAALAGMPGWPLPKFNASVKTEGGSAPAESQPIPAVGAAAASIDEEGTR